MVATPPPDILAYNRGSTNHMFFASPDICTECYLPGTQAEDAQGAVEAKLHQLQGLIEAAILHVMAD